MVSPTKPSSNTSANPANTSMTTTSAIRVSAAVGIIRDHGAPAPEDTRAACHQIALLQYFNALWESGDEMTRQALKENPSKIFSLINAICRMTNSNLAIEKQRAAKPKPDP